MRGAARKGGPYRDSRFARPSLPLEFSRIDQFEPEVVHACELTRQRLALGGVHQQGRAEAAEIEERLLD